MIKRVFHGYKTKQTSTKQAPCLYQLRTKTPDKIMLISLNISGMFNQSSGISGYSARPPQPDGSSSQEQCGDLGAPWPQKVKQRGCLANLSETNTSKHFRDWSAVSSLSECQDYYLVEKQSHKDLLSPLQDDLLQPWAAASPVHSENKGGKNRNVDSLKENDAALEGTDRYKQLWWEESSSFSSQATLLWACSWNC